MRTTAPVRPGDVYVNSEFGFGGSPWRVALVLHVDRGQMPTKRELNDGRPASLWAMMSGPTGETIMKMGFGWFRSNKWDPMSNFCSPALD